MSQYGAELHKFIIGDKRTDGWKSPWRIKLERDMAEDAAKPRPIVKAKQIQVRQIERTYADMASRREIVRKSLLKRRTKLKAEGICVDCGKGKAKEGRTSCGLCLKARYERQKRKRAELKK